MCCLFLFYPLPGGFFVPMTQQELHRIIDVDMLPRLTDADIYSFVLPSILKYLDCNEVSARFIRIEELSGSRIDFEIEEEQRIFVDTQDLPPPTWEKDVEDIYDPSGTFRIRLKNGQPRVSIKIPIPERNTYRTKCCLRIEIVPADEQQRQFLLSLRAELLKDGCFKVMHKKATQIQLLDGRTVWLNKNEAGKCWIEVDGGDYEIEHFLPEGITYLGHGKSIIRSREVNDITYDNLLEGFDHNTQVTSRTAKGNVDTSVSARKEGTSLNVNETKQRVAENTGNIVEYVWAHKYDPITSPSQLKTHFTELALLVNSGIQDGVKLRTWDVPYGHKIAPGAELEQAVETFYQRCWKFLHIAEKGHMDSRDLASWVEWEVDAGMHPFADGCGRIAKAWSAFLLTRLDTKLPVHESRDQYYGATNEGLSAFMKYYQQVSRSHDEK